MAKAYLDYFNKIMNSVLEVNDYHLSKEGVYVLCPKDLMYIEEGLKLLASAKQIEFEAESGYAESDEFEMTMRKKNYTIHRFGKESSNERKD